MKSVLFVLTNHSDLGNTGKKTGYWVSEVAHPYSVLKNHFKITFASPLGGPSPVDPGSLQAHSSDPVVQQFLADAVVQGLIANTLILGQLNPNDYDALFYPGGHGPMYDLAEHPVSLAFAATCYDNKRIVASLCHGPAALVNVKLSDGSYLVSGKNVTGFANTEEDAVGLSSVVPFLLEEKLKERGALYQKGDKDWDPKVVVDGRLITGQNPASATPLAEKIKDLLLAEE